MDSSRRILYLQYTNPAGYPPLEHSSRILADRGWKILFLGVPVSGVEGLVFPERKGIEVRLFSKAPGGLRTKLHYFRFLLWSLWRAAWFRPDWIYASDPWSCPVAWAMKRLLRARLLYHEHDSPGDSFPTRAFHEKVAREADAIVFPQAKRAEAFQKIRQPKAAPAIVLNCPSVTEIPARVGLADAKPLRLLFQGSIGPTRLPLALIRALNGLPIELLILGYVPNGASGHFDSLQAEARALGIEKQIKYLGSLPHHEMLKVTATAHVGLSLMPLTSRDINERHMVGASNKAFDHLAFGAPLLVSDLPEWREWFVDAKFALACEPENPESIAAALRWFVEHPQERAEMGRRGHERCLGEWNYEAQFAPVLGTLEGSMVESNSWPRTAKSS